MPPEVKKSGVDCLSIRAIMKKARLPSGFLLWMDWQVFGSGTLQEKRKALQPLRTKGGASNGN
ncbi:hypothetical protein [Paenibacillus sp. 1P03SA]|uniref:hypothetical protein n=1 Tax=Paenibacillus sp. 1P03SA TaxID=3132294 RepID=UPI0039A167CE